MATSRPAPKVPKGQPNSAKAILTEMLSRFGLGSLANWAWKIYTNAGGGDVGIQLMQAELPNTPEFKTRFPAIAQRQSKGLAAISPAEYISYETTLREAFSAHGLVMPTTGTKFNDLVSSLLSNDVSAAEVVNQRIGSAFSRVATAPIEVRQAAERLWGIHGDAALASLFLSPEHSAPELEKLSQSMDIAGNASRYGINISKERAGRLADLGADTHLDRLQQLVQMAPLFHANVGEDTGLTIEEQGLASAFGENATAQTEVNRRLAERKAALGGAGGPASTSRSGYSGLTGLGEGSGG